MTQDAIYVEGELYLSLEAVAEVYQVKSIWLREVYDQGLLGSGVDAGQRLCIAAVQLDRVATIVRWNQVLGLDLDTIAVSLGDD